MKKFWKILGIAAIAAVIPVRFKRDEEKGKKTYQSLLFSVEVGPGEDGEGTDIGVNIGEGGIIGSAIANLMTAREEAELYADDDPEAAMLDAEELQIITNEAQEAAAAQEADDDDESDSEF